MKRVVIAVAATLVTLAASMSGAAARAERIGSSSPGGAEPDRIVVQDDLTQPVFSYEDAIRETVYVQSTIDDDLDGDLDLLATDIIRPRATEGDLQVPVIYEMSPYYQELGRGNESEIKNEEDGDYIPDRFPLFYDNYFVPRGYAVVLQDMRGTRNSEGCMELGGIGELIDAQATVDWLNGRGAAFTAAGDAVEATWSTGKVGMIGKSYDGSVANGAASTGVKGLETIVPIAAISRWYDYHLHNGTQYLNAYLTPANFSFVIDQTPGDDEERGAAWAEATFTEGSVCSARGAEIVAQAGNPAGDYNAFWDERDYLKDIDKVTASVFLIHGLNDYNVKPNNFVAWWEAIARRNLPRKIWLAQVAHVDPFDFRRPQWVLTLHRWFDYWLQGVNNGIMSEPMLDIERESGHWTTGSTWPAAAARRVKVFMQGNGGLRAVPAKTATMTFTDDPGQGENTMTDGAVGAGPNRLLWKSPTLKRDVRISGRMKVAIQATVDRADTNFTALLVDYGATRRIDPEVRTTEEETCHGDGTAADDPCYFLTEETASNNPVHIVSRGWLDARHHESLRSNSPLVPGTRYAFRWDIFGDDYVFKKGHQIGLVIAGSDADFTVPDPSLAEIVVDIGKSHVVLPIVGGATATRRAGL
ncbi:MAG TPA: CocE/NonD family hydrolase [Actinomycetota bacterium]|nr:CocE/NonD family hydrolase [Actinomycetota bacterium]